MKHILILPDGSRIGSGPGTVTAIKSVTLTRTVNDGTSLTPGSAVASELEVSLFTPGGSLALTAGQEVQLLRADDAGNEYPLGIFLLEKPLRPTPNTMRLTGFDRLVKLDKDLTVWLSGLTGWPYPLLTFAKMVCTTCGVTLITENVPNADYPIPRFTREGVTGRQLIRWLGELCCRYCAANPAGALEFGWYTDAGVALAPAGEHFYFQNGLSYEDYSLASPDGVQLRLGEGEEGYLWPPAQGERPYILTGNPLLSAVTPQTESALQTVARELSGLGYTPCKVTVPAASPLQPGHRFTVTTPRGETLASLVMSRTDAPGKTTLEATGSPRGSTADKPLGQLMQEAADRAQQTAVSAAAADATAKADAALSDAKTYADSAASNAVSTQTQADIFNKLTNNGQLPGLFMQDGQLYINASYLATGILASRDGKTFHLDLDNGILKGEFAELSISGKTVDAIAQDKADAAQSNAVSIAAGDAANKANAAQQSAISAAAADATAKANAALSDARTYADGAAAGAVNAQTQADIFNKLTNNGQLPGLFMQDGQLYINASYLKTGVIDAAVVQVANLVAEKLKSVAGSSELTIDGAVLRYLSNGNRTIELVNDADGLPILYMTDYSGSTAASASELTPHHLKIGGRSYDPLFQVAALNGCSEMKIDSVNPGKRVLFSGNVTRGNTCTVPHTARYDLFAIKLWDGATTYDTMVLAYKTGNVVRGVGGWAGTATESKQLFFFSAAIDGDTWTLEDAGFHYVYIGGTVEEGIRLNLREVIGVI